MSITVDHRAEFDSNTHCSANPKFQQTEKGIPLSIPPLRRIECLTFERQIPHVIAAEHGQDQPRLRNLGRALIVPEQVFVDVLHQAVFECGYGALPVYRDLHCAQAGDQ
jgi:hypothetical protein